MLAATCLICGLLLAQPPAATPPLAAATAGPRLEFMDTETTMETVGPPETPKEKDAPSIFSRPFFADRSALSFVTGTGPGRLNFIDWENRPNGDRLWWLSRWPAEEEVQLHLNIGFNIHWWAGPVGNGVNAAPHLPPRVYDLYLDGTWAQRWTSRLSSEVRFQPGLYTDFKVTPPDAFRAPGQAIFLFRLAEPVHVVGGVANLQRNDIKVLPVGGVLWQPTPGWELRLVFPEPKIAFQLSPRHHVWGYVAGEYGGGRWTYDNAAGRAERVEYSDYRLVFGIEWREDHLSNLKLLPQKSASFIELGHVWQREIRFTGPALAYEPEPAWMIRFGRVW